MLNIIKYLLNSDHAKIMDVPTVDRGINAPYSGRSHTMKKNLRKVKKAQRRRAYYRSLRA